MTTQRIHLSYALSGLLLGGALGFIGFADFGEVHRMFTFADLRLVFVFGCAVAASALGFFLFRSRGNPSPRPIHRGTVVGGVLFGLGWATSGACPAIVMVQLGEAKLLALWTLAGILGGTWLYAKVHARYFRWDTGSCES